MHNTLLACLLIHPCFLGRIYGHLLGGVAGPVVNVPTSQRSVFRVWLHRDTQLPSLSIRSMSPHPIPAIVLAAPLVHMLACIQFSWSNYLIKTTYMRDCQSHPCNIVGFSPIKFLSTYWWASTCLKDTSLELLFLLCRSNLVGLGYAFSWWCSHGLEIFLDSKTLHHPRLLIMSHSSFISIWTWPDWLDSQYLVGRSVCAITALDGYPHIGQIHYIRCNPYICTTTSRTMLFITFCPKHSSHPPFASGWHLFHLSQATQATSSAHCNRQLSCLHVKKPGPTHGSIILENSHRMWWKVRQWDLSGDKVPLTEMYLTHDLVTLMYPLLDLMLTSKGLRS